ADLSKELTEGANDAPDADGHKPTDVTIMGVELYFLPVETRVPLKFGTETLTSVTCARVRLVATNREGRIAEGWGETPLSVQWAWPSSATYALRHDAMRQFCHLLAEDWAAFPRRGHALEIGHAYAQ